MLLDLLSPFAFFFVTFDEATTTSTFSLEASGAAAVLVIGADDTQFESSREKGEEERIPITSSLPSASLSLLHHRARSIYVVIYFPYGTRTKKKKKLSSSLRI